MLSPTDSDSDFEVVIEQRTHKKGPDTVKRSERYTKWAEADAAWCAYRDLIGLKQSGIVAADLIEHRRTVVHKQVRKEAEVQA